MKVNHIQWVIERLDGLKEAVWTLIIQLFIFVIIRLLKEIDIPVISR